MRFFTLDWWRGLQDGEFDDPVADFRAHLEQIRDSLPANLLLLQEKVSLHDAHLRELVMDVNLRRLEMRFDGSDMAGHRRFFHLIYNGLETFRSTSDPHAGLAGPHGYGDLGYDEADVTENGKFQHCLLFSSGIELQIIFSEFELHWRDDLSN